MRLGMHTYSLYHHGVAEDWAGFRIALAQADGHLAVDGLYGRARVGRTAPRR